eukprot:scaffold266192_cov18-Tisochrysis_lutea.AAC.1
MLPAYTLICAFALQVGLLADGIGSLQTLFFWDSPDTGRVGSMIYMKRDHHLHCLRTTSFPSSAQLNQADSPSIESIIQ